MEEVRAWIGFRLWSAPLMVRPCTRMVQGPLIFAERVQYRFHYAAQKLWQFDGVKFHTYPSSSSYHPKYIPHPSKK